MVFGIIPECRSASLRNERSASPESPGILLGTGEHIKIRSLIIRNFRGIKHATIHFTDHSVLIGRGNCGKTTVIEALALLFGRARLVRNLTEHDFFGGDPKPGDRIELSAVLTGFVKNDPQENPDWFRPNRGGTNDFI
jgi:hypothetical protein